MYEEKKNVWRKSKKGEKSEKNFRNVKTRDMMITGIEYETPFLITNGVKSSIELFNSPKIKEEKIIMKLGIVVC